MTSSDRSAAIALWWVLVACWIVRLAGMTRATTALWAIDAAAYLPAWYGWTSWLSIGAALFPPIGAAMNDGLERIGRRFEKPSRETLIALFATVALALICLPDRVGFTGDFLLRLSSAKASGSPGILFPQALPLDLWLHYTVPHELARLRIAPVETTSRILDALEAGGLAVLVFTLVRLWGARGGGLAGAAVVILAGPPLAMYTGLNKAFTELLVLAAALATTTWPRPATSGRVSASLAILAAALLLHRAALLLTPLVVFTIIDWVRSPGLREPPWKRMLVVVTSLATVALAARALEPVGRIDFPHGLVWPLDPAPSVTLGARLFDLANLTMLLAPSIVLIPAMLLDAGMREHSTRARGWWWCACLAIPGALLILVVDAPQGYFRDWDMFALAGLLLSMVGAFVAARFLARTRGREWLWPAVVLSTLVPCVQMLALQTNEGAGLRRVATFAEAPARRPPVLRGSVLAFLAKRAWDNGDLAGAGAYARRSAELAPTPSMLTLWGETEERQGRFASAESVYVRLVATSPRLVRAWRGLVQTRLASGRPLEAAATAESALAIQPGSVEAAQLVRATHIPGTR